MIMNKFLKYNSIFLFLFLITSPLAAQNATPDESGSNPQMLSVDEVIQKYLTALGGKARLQSVNDLSITMETSIQNLATRITFQKKRPNKLVTTVKSKGIEIRKEIFDGEKSVKFSQGQKIRGSAENNKLKKISSYMWPEMHFRELNMDIELLEETIIDGEEAYAIKVTMPDGTYPVFHYSKETGLKINEMHKSKNALGNEVWVATVYSDYRTVDGIEFPYRITLPVGSQEIVAKITSVKVDAGLSDRLFNIN